MIGLRLKFLGVLSALLLTGGSAAGLTYRVKPKETFYSIAKKYSVSVSALMKRNGITDPRKLRSGQKLVIPSKATSKSTKKPVRKSRKVALKATRHYSSSKKKLRVVVDAGHGGKDKGAYWYGVSESSLNMRVARRVESSLKSRGYPVTMTRRSDVFISLGKRSQIANRYRNAIFVSIHFNATNNTRVSGAETYYAGKRGRYLASAIQSQLIKRLHVKNRGVRLGRYSVLMGTKCPAVLVECGFISNTYERNRCKTKSFQSRAAQAIVSGIERYDRIY